MWRVVLYLLGFFFLTMGFFYIIVYTNLFTFGYSIGAYMEFMVSHVRNYSLLLGLLLLLVAIYGKGKKRK